MKDKMNLSGLKISPFFAVFFLIFSSYLSAQQREGDLAVLEITFSGSELTKEQIGFLSDDIRGIAAKITNYRIMNKENIWTILRDKNIDPNKCVEAECEVDYGRILQADMVVTTNIIYAGGVYFIKMKMYDVSRATLENSVDRECAGCDFSKLRESVKDGAQELFGGVLEIGRITGSPVQEATPEVPKPQVQGYGSLVINTSPEGCQIYIDSEDYGLSPKTIDKVPAGERTIVLSKEGYSTSTEVIRIERGKKVVFNKTLAPQMGTIEVTVAGAQNIEPDKVQVYLDGKYRGTMPKEGKPLKIANILAGAHKIKAEHPDYEPAEQEVQVRYNAVEEVKIELKGKPGRVLVTSTPLKARVLVNGTEQGDTPYSTTLSPGKYTIRVTLKGYKSKEQEIEVKPNKSLTLNYELEALPKGQEDVGAVRETPDMVYIPAGEFMMGCAPHDSECGSDEKPYHKVYLDAYYIDKHEVTVAEYKKCVDAGVCNEPETGGYCNWGVSGRDNHPINCVSWNDADAYCRWAGKRLPTEAEWEKGARGTDGRIYPWGNEFDCHKGNFDDETTIDDSYTVPGGSNCDGYNTTSPVCSFPAGNSPYGLCDMSGNVWEWVQDWYGQEYYSSSPSSNPTGPSSGKLRVRRGGSWRFDFPVLFRSSDRIRFNPVLRPDDYGFRCVRRISE